MYSFAYLLHQLRARNVLDEEGELAGLAIYDQGDSGIDFLLQRLSWNENELKAFISSTFSIALFVDREILIDRKVLHWLNAGLSAKFRCIPLCLAGNQLRIAVDDPFSVPFWQTIENQLNLQVDLCLILRNDYQILYQQLYSRSAPPFVQISEVIPAYPSLLPWEIAEEQDELLQILEQAIQKNATDIHFEPLRQALRVRFRVDGRMLMHRMFEAEKKQNFISRLKIWAEMNIAQQRLPQDGQFQKQFGDEMVDFRISTLPLLFGEKAVLRLLRKAYMLSSPVQLGMRTEVLEQFTALLQRPQGMILVCGPTASGKTTTLYSALQQLDQEVLNIVTIEDPVEFHLPGIQQMQVHDKLQATFAKGLRAILRQDPDVILIGEIRDRETAEVAFQAALTGHLVFASLHANDAAGAITRLLDMGIEPFLLTSSISGILSQRLVRKLCPHCANYQDTNQDYFERIRPQRNRSIPKQLAQAGKGCAFCQQQPLQGRIGIFEILLPDEELLELILEKAPLQKIRQHAYNQGMKPYYWDGLEKVALGQTSLSEILPYFPVEGSCRSSNEEILLSNHRSK